MRREPLGHITDDDVEREGFRCMTPHEFIRRFFVEKQRIGPTDEVTRIEWRYVSESYVSP